MEVEKFISGIFNSKVNNFDDFALQAFHYQLKNNAIYQKYCQFLGVTKANEIQKVNQIPFLPIDLFKTHKIISGELSQPVQKAFSSSSTSGKGQSYHHVADLSLYERSFTTCFELFYGNIKNYNLLALLPSYLEREGSSLVYMVENLIKKCDRTHSAFYLHEQGKLLGTLQQLQQKKQPAILFGATFALLDFAENSCMDMSNIIVMETGGMKGRRTEITRQEVHETLKKRLNLKAVHAEYGMTELLSQAYSKQGGLYQTPPWMKIFITDVNDPFRQLETGKTGVINVIDLVNIYSCCFIKTCDLGRVNRDGSFEVLGRLDNSDLRGCSLLVA